MPKFNDFKEKTMKELTHWNSLLGDLVFPFTDNFEDKVYSPKMDINKTDGAYQIKLAIPGVKKEDLSLEVEDDHLVISGSSKQESEEKDNKEKVYSEISSYTHFKRSVSIDQNRFDVEKIKADLKDGILEVNVPLLESAQKKRLAISVN